MTPWTLFVAVTTSCVVAIAIVPSLLVGDRTRSAPGITIASDDGERSSACGVRRDRVPPTLARRGARPHSRRVPDLCPTQFL